MIPMKNIYTIYFIYFSINWLYNAANKLFDV